METAQTAWHPWSFVEEEMQARGWDRDELARRMGNDFAVDRLTLDLLEATQDRTDLTFAGETGAALGRAFGVSPELFVNLYDRWKAAQTATP